MKAEWKLRDEQLHCQHGVNEDTSNEKRLYWNWDTINYCGVGRRFLRVLLQICYVQNSNNSAEYIQFVVIRPIDNTNIISWSNNISVILTKKY